MELIVCKQQSSNKDRLQVYVNIKDYQRDNGRGNNRIWKALRIVCVCIRFMTPHTLIYC